MATKTRSKFGYLNYDRMLAKIATNELDAYDINFTPDTHECYIIAPDLTPWAIKSRVYTYQDIETAELELNKNSDTYAGQIVSIKYSGGYTAYIVNESEGKFTVEALSAEKQEINYDTLGNKPIINKEGSLAEPVIISGLADGIYRIDGQYRINEQQTMYQGNGSDLFLVHTENGKQYIKIISAKEITSYVVDSDNVSKTSMVTTDFLESNKYVREDYVDEKIAALNVFTRDEAEKYIEDYLANHSSITSVVSSEVERQLDAKIAEVEEDDVNNMFS